LNIGGTQQLTATVVVQNGAATTVTWSSSNTTVASVSNTGLVTANAAGTATITATSTVDGSKKGTATITVNAPTISGVSISPPSALLNIGGTQQFTANVTGSLGFNPAVTWSTSNATVASVSNTGLVTANAAGTATITATSVADPSKSASATVTVVDTLTFQNYSAVVATVGQAIPTQNANVAGGSTPYSFTAIDPLPAGLSLNPASGAISGTPTTASAATNYTIQVTDSLGATASATINITVNAAPSVSYSQTLALTTGIPVTPANYSGSASGGTAPLSYSASGLPAGLSIDSSTGVISGTPSSAGSSSVTVTVTDVNGATAESTFTFDVNPALSFSSGYTNATLTAGVAYTSATPVVTGGTTPRSFSVSPALPAGLNLNSSTGVISGTPSSASPSTTYTVTVTDSNGATATTPIQITVNPALTLTYTSPVTYNRTSITPNQILASPVVSGGTGTLTYSRTSVSGPNFGPNLNFNTANGNVTNKNAGLPDAGTYVMDITVQDQAGGSATFTLTIIINP
jgi:hypothetical protein